MVNVNINNNNNTIKITDVYEQTNKKKTRIRILIGRHSSLGFLFPMLIHNTRSSHGLNSKNFCLNLIIIIIYYNCSTILILLTPHLWLSDVRMSVGKNRTITKQIDNNFKINVQILILFGNYGHDIEHWNLLSFHEP